MTDYTIADEIATKLKSAWGITLTQPRILANNKPQKSVLPLITIHSNYVGNMVPWDFQGSLYTSYTQFRIEIDAATLAHAKTLYEHVRDLIKAMTLDDGYIEMRTKYFNAKQTKGSRYIIMGAYMENE